MRRPILLAATFALAVLAVTCAAAALGSPYNRLRWSDTMINKAHRSWSICPGVSSCKGRCDLEGTVTLERGHIFGLGRVSRPHTETL